MARAQHVTTRAHQVGSQTTANCCSSGRSFCTSYSRNIEFTVGVLKHNKCEEDDLIFQPIQHIRLLIQTLTEAEL